VVVAGVHAVAVLIDAVGDDLRGAGVDRRAGVVAVVVVAHGAGGAAARLLRHGRVAEAVAVGIGVPGGVVDGPLVDRAVAVVVDLVADLGGVRVDRRVGVVAVVGVGDEARRRRARPHGGARVAEAVAVGVRVPGGGGRAFVDRAVAVVVHAVADVGRAGVDRRAGVVAVAADVDVAFRRRARGHGGGRVAVA